jgi:V/A-type H+/Na+-transporting ATPase subunit E
MSAETLISRIKNDAKQDADTILATAKKQSKQMMKDALEEANKQVEMIIDAGKKEQENIKRIKISQAQQEAKRLRLQAKENVIDECFQKALQQLQTLPDETYSQMIEALIKQALVQIPDGFSISYSKPLDKTIAKKHDIPLKGSCDAIGGFIITSEDGRMSIDNTFEGILKRKKDEIRVQVGKLLFS